MKENRQSVLECEILRLNAFFFRYAVMGNFSSLIGD